MMWTYWNMWSMLLVQVETKLQTRRSVWKGAQQIPNTTTSTTVGRQGAGVTEEMGITNPEIQPHRDLQSLAKHCSISAFAIAKKHKRDKEGEGKGPLSAFWTCNGKAGGLDRLSFLHLLPVLLQALLCYTSPLLIGRQLALSKPCSTVGGLTPLPPSAAKFKEHDLFETFPCALVLSLSFFCLFYNPALLMERKGCTYVYVQVLLGSSAIPMPQCISVACRDRSLFVPSPAQVPWKAELPLVWEVAEKQPSPCC